jgi:hypothetical protein
MDTQVYGLYNNPAVVYKHRKHNVTVSGKTSPKLYLKRIHNDDFRHLGNIN